VLELDSGTGIVGISAMKWTHPAKVTMTHTEDQGVANIRRNGHDNGVKSDHFVAIKMKLGEETEFKMKYHAILAANPFIHQYTP
jgi:16S rRNA G1207 methylase RsmC